MCFILKTMILTIESLCRISISRNVILSYLEVKGHAERCGFNKKIFFKRGIGILCGQQLDIVRSELMENNVIQSHKAIRIVIG